MFLNPNKQEKYLLLFLIGCVMSNRTETSANTLFVRRKHSNVTFEYRYTFAVCFML